MSRIKNISNGLANNRGLSQSTIGTWYRNNQTPTIQTLDKVCRGLGITLSQFLPRLKIPFLLLRKKGKCWPFGALCPSENANLLWVT